MGEERKTHWEDVYAGGDPTQVSWYQLRPERSLALIDRVGIDRGDAILDVGGGASTLVDHLMQRGYTDLTVLDLAEPALAAARARLGRRRAERVNWICRDITAFRSNKRFALWHDRAVLHFLTDISDRGRYLDTLNRVLATNGHVVLATFAPEGPPRCSGLPVMHYDAEGLAVLLGPDYRLLESDNEAHTTPSGMQQAFTYTLFRREAH